MVTFLRSVEDLQKSLFEYPQTEGNRAMSSDGRTALVLFLLSGIALLPGIGSAVEPAVSPAEVSEVSQLSPANDVFDLNQEGLRLLWRAELGDITETRIKALYTTSSLVVVETPSGEVHVLDAATGKWKTMASLSHGLECAPVQDAQKLYMISHNHLYALDIDENKLEQLYHVLFSVSAPPVVRGEHVALAGNNGHVASVDTSTWRQNWLATMTGSIWEQPLLSDHKLLAAGGEVLCVQWDGGDEEWRWAPPKPAKLSSSIELYDGEVYVGDNYGVLYALEADSGEVDWNTNLKAPIVGKPRVVQDTLLVRTNAPSLLCVQIKGERKVLWEQEEVTRILASSENIAYVMKGARDVSAILLKTGEELWRDRLPPDCITAGDPKGPTFYVGDATGALVAFQEVD